MTDSGLTSRGEVEVATLDGGACTAQPTAARRMTKGRARVIGSSGGPEPHNAQAKRQANHIRLRAQRASSPDRLAASAPVRQQDGRKAECERRSSPRLPGQTDHRCSERRCYACAAMWNKADDLLHCSVACSLHGDGIGTRQQMLESEAAVSMCVRPLVGRRQTDM